MQTVYVYPPIGNRSFDWMAYNPDDECGCVGWGKTEQEAIQEFIELGEDDEY